MKCPSCGYTDELPKCPLCGLEAKPGEAYDVGIDGSCIHVECKKKASEPPAPPAPAPPGPP